MKRTLVVSFACLALVAAVPARGQQIRNIHDIDFKNFTYADAPCAGEGEPITVKNGVYERDQEDDKVYFEIRGVVFGDLTGDGVDEAVVRTLCNTGGTGQFTDALVYTLRGGKPTVIGELGIGDRADGGLYDVRIRDGVLYADRFGHGEGSGACCPEYIETSAFRWNGKTFAETGKATQRAWVDYQFDDSPAPHRVKFLRGSSAATLSGSTNNGESYLIGARAGQTLGLHFKTDDDKAEVSVAVKGGEAFATINANGDGSLKLPATGDYVISVRSPKPKDDENVWYQLDLTIS
jgi:hypothetical protein